MATKAKEERKKSRRVEIRVSDEEHAREQAAATALGMTLSEFYRQAAQAQAEQVLAEQTSIVLDDEEAANFIDALDHPERFEPGLRRLVEHPSVLSA